MLTNSITTKQIWQRPHIQHQYHCLSLLTVARASFSHGDTGGSNDQNTSRSLDAAHALAHPQSLEISHICIIDKCILRSEASTGEISETFW